MKSRFLNFTGCLALLFAGITTMGCEEGPMVDEPLAAPAASERPLEDSPPPITAEPLVCDANKIAEPGATVSRRLTGLEYINTVRDLIGSNFILQTVFPPEEEVLGFDNIARALQVTPLHAERYMDAAEKAARYVVEEFDNVSPCTPRTDAPQECAAQFIAHFGLRAWRRPLTESEQRRFQVLFEYGMSAEGNHFLDGVSLVVEALLQSPNFLYRIEVGQPIDGTQDRLLTNYELASKLSYFLWRTMPDEALFQAAEDGQLETAEELAVQVERMSNDPKARDGLWTFFAQWLHLDEVDTLERDANLHPYFDESSRDAMLSKAREFIEDITWSGNGDLSALFDTEFELPFDPDEAERVGILSLPALLAVTSKPNMTSPIHRGVFVREQLLCTVLPPPPPDIMVVAPDPDPTLTTREQFAIHSSDPACSSCHRLVDPIGFGFEHFDEVGVWRNTQNQFDVDAAGEVVAADDLNGAFYGVAQLSRRMSRSTKVHDCIATQFFRYAMGRAETKNDACWLRRYQTQYRDSGFSMDALIGGIVDTPGFRLKRSEAP